MPRRAPQVVSSRVMDGEGQNAGPFTAVYEELRKTARAYLRKHPSHTLQPTSLVHEAFLKLRNADPERWQSPDHFSHVAARAMRQILVDHARHKLAQKRQNSLPAGDPECDTEERLATLLHIDDALRQLEAADSQLARVVELRFFLGCSEQETGKLLGLQEGAVRRRWGLAKAFLAERLETKAS